MLLSVSPKGFFWNSATKTSQTLEIRVWTVRVRSCLCERLLLQSSTVMSLSFS
uniref:Uncharacterized protein n=1 Tax=Anguilla anguilla TaxID=7936 RepID=A0A0E9X688_ANGAN